MAESNGVLSDMWSDDYGDNLVLTERWKHRNGEWLQLRNGSDGTQVKCKGCTRRVFTRFRRVVIVLNTFSYIRPLGSKLPRSMEAAHGTGIRNCKLRETNGD